MCRSVGKWILNTFDCSETTLLCCQNMAKDNYEYLRENLSSTMSIIEINTEFASLHVPQGDEIISETKAKIFSECSSCASVFHTRYVFKIQEN